MSKSKGTQSLEFQSELLRKRLGRVSVSSLHVISLQTSHKNWSNPVIVEANVHECEDVVAVGIDKPLLMSVKDVADHSGNRTLNVY